MCAINFSSFSVMKGFEKPSQEPTVHFPPKDPRSKYKCNPFCRIFFSWVDPLLWKGFKRPLHHSDLFVHPQESDSRYLLGKFNRYWSKELNHRQNGGSPSLLRVLLKCLWWRMIVHGIFSLSGVSSLIVLSVVVGLLSNYFTLQSPSSTDTRNAYLYGLGILVLSLFTVVVHGLAFHYSHYLGMLARVLFSNALFQKMLVLSHTTVNRVTVGHIVNLASNDLHRFDTCFLSYQYYWISPLHLSTMTILLYYQISWTAFLATGLVILQVPVQICLMIIFSKLRFKAALLTDKRIKIMNEVITGIRVIKMYGWEYPFNDLVATIRKSEVWLVIQSSIIRAINLSYFNISLPFIMFVVFSVYVTITPEEDNIPVLTPQKVFTTLALLSFVRVTLFPVVQGFLYFSEARVAFKRIKEFLLLEELPVREAIANGEISANGVIGTNEEIPLTNRNRVILSINDITASWDMDHDKPSLQNISFTLDKDNSLLVVVGKVGAGKSTLIQCLLQELPCMSGSIDIQGTLGYASQEPWIFSATVRDNITFGLPYRPDWYDKVIESCALDKDMDILPDGDLTLVGERGVTLSGGQKARLNLARAVYRDADIYLLDDPLSAVDTVVSRHIFDSCIKKFLSDKLVILATHQLQYVQQCDYVLGLNEGQMTVYGNPIEVLAGGDVIDLLGCTVTKNEEDDPKNVYAVRKQSLTQSIISYNTEEPPPPMNVRRKLSVVEEETYLELEGADPFLMSLPAIDTVSYNSIAVSFIENDDGEEIKDQYETNREQQQQQQIIQHVPIEDRSYGAVTMKTYYHYFRAGGSVLSIALVFFIFIFSEGNLVAADWWISSWSACSAAKNDTTDASCHLDNNQRIGIFGGLVLGVIITAVLRNCLFFILVLNSARNLHDNMFAAVTRAPILFFNTNPIGRILNRFSKDIGFLDDVIPNIFCYYLQLLFRTFAIVTTAMVANPITIATVIVLVIVFVLIRWYYLKSGREIKRLEAIARSPVYSHISLTLQGLSTIRSYCMQSESMEQFYSYQNRHSQTWYAYLVSVRWFGIRVDLVSAVYVSIVAFTMILLAGYFENAGLIGLALTYTITLNGMFQYCIRQSAEVESLMISAERVMAYSKLESEASLETLPPASPPPKEWPSQGHIEFQDLSYRHSSDGPLVLKGINCTINGGEKVGIVGRTGAGKSSLISSLFRLAEPIGGIVIDNIQVCSLGLHDIRSKLSIIPQDPVLFGGTVRYNLDPFNIFEDEQIWKALEQVQLKTNVQSHDGQLDGIIHEGGGNFSVGQRQLFCLARALLRDNTILIMDEATANVDLETDGIIQEVIREQFASCTVLTVAHRLDTVMDSDRIMVLRNGLLCEFDEPHILLLDNSSYLHRLVEHTGAAAAENLKEMALVAYNKRRDVS